MQLTSIESTAAVSSSGDATPSPQILLRNMAALWRRDPELAQRIDEIPDEQRISLTPTRSGHYTAVVETGGEKNYLHSRYDPVAEAKKLIASVSLDDCFCFLVCGFALGYHVRRLFDLLKGEPVVVVGEPSLPLLAAGLACTDLADAIDSGRLIILDRPDKAVLHERLKPFNTLMMLGSRIVVHPPSRRAAEEFHATTCRLMTDFVAYQRMTLMTLVGNAEITCRNIAHNLPHYLATPPIDILRARFKGRAAVIVAGGPSLRRNIDLLAEAKGKAVLIAVQTTFKPLMKRNIVPDFVTSLDFHSMSRQFFSGVTDFRGVHLVAEPKVSWDVLDGYRGPMSLLHNAFAEELIGPSLARRDGLKPGATVAHLAYYLAEYMGCDPIIFVGQDLAFTGHLFYMPGVEVHHTWRSEINRFNSMETKEWERIARNRAILRKVTDINGKEIYTDELLFTYLEQFERDFAATHTRIIDATEGGARIRGTETATLRDTIDRYCTEPLPEEAFAYRNTAEHIDSTKVESARAELRDRIVDVNELREVCVETLEQLHAMRELTDDPDRFNQRLVRVDELRSAVARSQRAYRIVNAATQLAEFQRYSADRKLEAADAVGAERAIRQLDRDTRFVESVRRGAEMVVEMLESTIVRFDEDRPERRS